MTGRNTTTRTHTHTHTFTTHILPSCVQTLADIAFSLLLKYRALTVTRYCVPGWSPVSSVEFLCPRRLTVWTWPLGMAPYSTLYLWTLSGCMGPQLTYTLLGPNSDTETTAGLNTSGEREGERKDREITEEVN